MKEDKKVPQLRFPEFTDAWKQCKLSDLVNVIDGDRGKNYPTEADFEPHGHTLFLNASNVTIDGFLFDTNQFITEEKSNSMGSGKIIKDDIIITSRGSLGHIAWYNDSVQQVMPHLRINSGMLILRNKANVKTSYLHQFMKSDKGKAQIVFMSFGSAQPQLTKKGVESFTVNYPIDTEEQINIGAFFSKLDNTITLQQRKLNSLQKLKRGLLQKMFPKKGENIPEIRFPEFSDAWKQRELNEIADTIDTGKSIFSKSNIGKFKILGSTGVIGFDEDYDYEGSFLLTARVGANAGNLYRSSGKVKITDNTVFIKSKFIDYLFYSLEKFNLKRLSFGTGQPLIKSSELKKLDISVPCDENEITKIEHFFITIDRTITLQQRKLESLQKLKKGLLQQMFI